MRSPDGGGRSGLKSLLSPQHVVVVCKFVAAWFVPNNPIKVKNDRLLDKLDRLKEELQ